jgi:hypothetical protein
MDHIYFTLKTKDGPCKGQGGGGQDVKGGVAICENVQRGGGGGRKGVSEKKKW